MSKECLTIRQARDKLGASDYPIFPVENELVTKVRCIDMGADTSLLAKYLTDKECPADDDIMPGNKKLFGPYSIYMDAYEDKTYTVSGFNPSKGFKVDLIITSYILSNNVAGRLWSIDIGDTSNVVISMITYGGVIGLTLPANDIISLGPLPSDQSMNLSIIYRPEELAVELIMDGSSQYHPVNFSDSEFPRLIFGNVTDAMEAFNYQIDNFTLYCPYIS